jgi:hypothetical protein
MALGRQGTPFALALLGTSRRRKEVLALQMVAYKRRERIKNNKSRTFVDATCSINNEGAVRRILTLLEQQGAAWRACSTRKALLMGIKPI